MKAKRINQSQCLPRPKYGSPIKSQKQKNPKVDIGGAEIKMRQIFAAENKIYRIYLQIDMIIHDTIDSKY
jgi:hypothetical protein